MLVLTDSWVVELKAEFCITFHYPAKVSKFSEPTGECGCFMVHFNANICQMLGVSQTNLSN